MCLYVCKKKYIIISFTTQNIFCTLYWSYVFIRSQQFSLSFSLPCSKILPFSENILCHYLPPLWAFTWPVVYSYFNFKSYSYFIPVLYFRNILSSLPEDLPRGHSEGIHFIPLRFIPSRTRLNYSLVSCICFTNVYIYITLPIFNLSKKEWTLEYIVFSFNCNFSVVGCTFSWN